MNKAPIFLTESDLIIQEKGALIAIRKLLKYKSIPIKKKYVNLKKAKKAGEISKATYDNAIDTLSMSALGMYNHLLTQYGYMAYQVDPAHAGQTLSKLVALAT